MASEIVQSAVDEYLRDRLPERDPVLREMEKQAAERDIPIVGPAVARVLYQYARLIQAKKIFEMGSAIGYSTLWWALAVGEDGEVFYTDGDKK
ncbi:MAG TPA: O-methyltransferase, partial [Candidatus Angelobacter sp.]|nr:O-methyltransferase [Candidatus Angelobacter sp.]